MFLEEAGFEVTTKDGVNVTRWHIWVSYSGGDCGQADCTVRESKATKSGFHKKKGGKSKPLVCCLLFFFLHYMFMIASISVRDALHTQLIRNAFNA